MGEYKGAHNLQVSVYYDYKDSPEEVFLFNMADNEYGNTYGDGATYGDPEDVVLGTLGGIYQFQIQFAKQKCQAIRLVIQGLYPESTGTAAFNLSAVTFLVATKKGLERLPVSQHMESL